MTILDYNAITAFAGGINMLSTVFNINVGLEEDLDASDHKMRRYQMFIEYPAGLYNNIGYVWTEYPWVAPKHWNGKLLDADREIVATRQLDIINLMIAMYLLKKRISWTEVQEMTCAKSDRQLTRPRRKTTTIVRSLSAGT